jgi:toxin ParE1/3/4
VRRYRLSQGARADLDRIWDFIAERSSAEVASEFIWKFYDTFASIGSSPAAGVAIPELLAEGARKFPMGNYLIYYRSKRGMVEILRVLHGKRLQKRALRGKR